MIFARTTQFECQHIITAAKTNINTKHRLFAVHNGCTREFISKSWAVKWVIKTIFHALYFETVENFHDN